ncbi:MAG: hypothetical protein B6D61_14605 [Bacteroidetes bacterium 4484_249]|nr:MAG: hypothetical protein B6D61_14605 [Bacteroidetes bacterium 4484_249]
MNDLEKALKQKKRANRLFIWGLGIVEIGLVVFILFNTFMGILEGTSVFSIIALDLVLLWMGILIAYYAWAIYFYNINLGLTNESWARLNEQAQKIKELENFSKRLS